MPPSSSPDATLTDGEDPVRRRVIVHLILAFAAEPATTPTVRLQEIRDIRRGTSPRVARLVALLSTLAARSGGRSDARADGPNPPSDVDRSLESLDAVERLAAERLLGLAHLPPVVFAPPSQSTPPAVGHGSLLSALTDPPSDARLSPRAPPGAPTPRLPTSPTPAMPPAAARRAWRARR